MRKAVVAYSIRNRRSKAARIANWMREHGCKTVLLVGTVGRDNLDPNTSIVEDRIADEFEIKMGVNVVECDTGYPFTVADGRDLPFGNGYADIAIANAIIEHVGDRED